MVRIKQLCLPFCVDYSIPLQPYNKPETGVNTKGYQHQHFGNLNRWMTTGKKCEDTHCIVKCQGLRHMWNGLIHMTSYLRFSTAVQCMLEHICTSRCHQPSHTNFDLLTSLFWSWSRSSVNFTECVLDASFSSQSSSISCRQSGSETEAMLASPSLVSLRSSPLNLIPQRYNRPS